MPRTRNSPDNCFLCRPGEHLVYAQDENCIALCGLGPIVPGYSVVGTKAHLASAADAIETVPSLIKFAEDVRSALAAKYDTCLVTEHGRVPVCTDAFGNSDPHCYHAHFLLFPGVPDLSNGAAPYFAATQEAFCMKDALKIGLGLKEYFLLSPNSGSFYVMSRPTRLVRQFARLLVADSVSTPELADWRNHPREDAAAATALELRCLFNGGNRQ